MEGVIGYTLYTSWLSALIAGVLAKALFNVTKTGVTFKARGLASIPVLDSRGGLEYLDYDVGPARSKFTTNPFIACH